MLSGLKKNLKINQEISKLRPGEGQPTQKQPPCTPCPIPPSCGPYGTPGIPFSLKKYDRRPVFLNIHLLFTQKEAFFRSSYKIQKDSQENLRPI